MADLAFVSTRNGQTDRCSTITVHKLKTILSDYKHRYQFLKWEGVVVGMFAVTLCTLIDN